MADRSLEGSQIPEVKQPDIIFQRSCDHVSHALVEGIRIAVGKIWSDAEAVCFSHQRDFGTAVADVYVFIQKLIEKRFF